MPNQLPIDPQLEQAHHFANKAYEGLNNHVGVDEEVALKIASTLRSNMLAQFEQGPTTIHGILEQKAREEAEATAESLRFDGMTGLKRQDVFHNDLERTVERFNYEGEGSDRRGAVVVLGDLMGLKRLNTAAGHAAGNIAKKIAADVLIERQRPEDEAYIIGGDEYALILRGVKPDENGNYDKVIKDLTADYEAATKQGMINEGLPVEEQHLGITMVGAAIEPGQTAQEVYENIDEELNRVHAQRRMQLPTEISKDDRII